MHIMNTHRHTQTQTHTHTRICTRNKHTHTQYTCNGHKFVITLVSFSSTDETKPILLKEGVVDAAIKKLQSTMSFVQFKALGTLRLLSQKQGEQ